MPRYFAIQLLKTFLDHEKLGCTLRINCPKSTTLEFTPFKSNLEKTNLCPGKRRKSDREVNKSMVTFGIELQTWDGTILNSDIHF